MNVNFLSFCPPAKLYFGTGQNGQGMGKGCQSAANLGFAKLPPMPPFPSRQYEFHWLLIKCRTPEILKSLLENTNTGQIEKRGPFVWFDLSLGANTCCFWIITINILFIGMQRLILELDSLLMPEKCPNQNSAIYGTRLKRGKKSLQMRPDILSLRLWSLRIQKRRIHIV